MTGRRDSHSAPGRTTLDGICVMAKNLLPFLVGIVAPLVGALYLLAHT